MKRLLVAIPILALCPARVRADGCDPRFCITWTTAWEQNGVKVEYSPSETSLSWDPPDPTVSGMWFRLDNQSDRPVKVCFSWEINGKEGFESGLDRAAHKYSQYQHSSDGIASIQVDASWGCLEANPRSQSGHQASSNITITRHNAAEDLHVRVFDVSLGGGPPQPGAAPERAEDRTERLTKRFDEAKAKRTKTPELSRLDKLCLQGDRSACEKLHPQEVHEDTDFDKRRQCFAVQHQCQANCSNKENVCWTNKCDPIREAARKQSKKPWYGDTSELKWNDCVATCRESECYASCPTCPLPRSSKDSKGQTRAQ